MISSALPPARILKMSPTGPVAPRDGALLSAVQDLFVTPLWMALVWAVHALVVMLEWCFTIQLLDSASAGLGAGLRQMHVLQVDCLRELIGIVVWDLVVAQIEQIAFAIVLENRTKNPAMPVVIGKLGVLELAI